MGEMADLLCDPFDEPDDYGDEGVTCKRCGESGLEWFHTGVRWRLMEADGAFHVCSNDSAADDFEVID